MRATTLAMALALASTLGLLGCDTLAVVNNESACELAAQHIAECNSQSVQPVTTCDAQAEAEANTILGLDCETLSLFGDADEGRSTATTKCSTEARELCHDMCVKLFEEKGLELVSSSCKVYEEGDELPNGKIAAWDTVRCQCKNHPF